MPAVPRPPSGQRAGARPATSLRFCNPLSRPHTDWLRHDFVVTGPASDVAALREAAAGPGVIPWHDPDVDRDEEDRVHALVRARDGSP